MSYNWTKPELTVFQKVGIGTDAPIWSRVCSQQT